MSAGCICWSNTWLSGTTVMTSRKENMHLKSWMLHKKPVLAARVGDLGKKAEQKVKLLSAKMTASKKPPCRLDPCLRLTTHLNWWWKMRGKVCWRGSIREEGRLAAKIIIWDMSFVLCFVYIWNFHQNACFAAAAAVFPTFPPFWEPRVCHLPTVLFTFSSARVPAAWQHAAGCQ